MQGRYRKAAAAAAALILTMTLTAGCGALGSSGDNEVTLRVVAADYGDSPQNSSAAYWKTLATDFEKANPNVKVEVSVYSWSQVDAKVAEMVKAGHAPDIAQIGAYADYAADGKLYRADELLSVRTEADFLGPLAEAGMIDKVQYGLPFVASTRLLFYNKKLFADAGITAKADSAKAGGAGWQPKTWADLAAAAKKLKAKGVKTPFALPLGREEAQAETMLWLLAGGGGYTDTEERYAIDSTANVRTFEWLRDELYGQGLTGPVEPGKLDRQAAFDAFTDGQAGMLNGHPALMKQAEAKGLDYGMVPMPTVDGEPHSTMGVADWVMAFRNGHRKEAGKFLDHLFTAENVTRFTETYGLLPATNSGYRAMERGTGDNSRRLRTFLPALPTARLYPVNKKSWAAVSEDVKQSIGSALRPAPDSPAKTLEDLAAKARGADGTR